MTCVNIAASMKRKETFAPSQSPLRTISLAAPASQVMHTELPEQLSQYPSMMSSDEKQLLYGLAKKYYTGQGIIIDAGIFLGASTHCFTAGLRESPSLEKGKRTYGRPIVSFEMGMVNPGMPSFFTRNNVPITVRPGQSFLPYLEEKLMPTRDLVDLRIGDIIEKMVDVEQPVEILFLDVLKLPTICDAVVSHFFTKLIPGRSIVIQQDYFNELLEYIKTYQEAFGDFFEYIGEVQSSAVFLCKKKITAEIVRASVASLSSKDKEMLATIALHRSIDPARRFLMSISKARLLAKLHGSSVALAYIEYVRTEYPPEVIGGDKFKRRLSNVVDVAITSILANNTRTD